MLSAIVFSIEVIILVTQILRNSDKGKFSILNASILFQLYFIIQLSLSSLLADVFKIGLVDRRIKATIDENTRNYMLIMVFSAHLSYLIGTITVGEKRFFIPKLKEYNKQNKTINTIIILLIGMGYLFFYYLMRSYGGVVNFMRQIEVWRNVGIIGNSMFTMMISNIMPIAMVIFIVHYSDKIKKGDLYAMILMAIIGVICTAPSLVMGFRSYIFNIIIMAIVAYNFRVKKISLKSYAIGVFAFSVYFASYSLYRASKKSGLDSIRYAINNIGYSFLKLFTRSRGSEIVCIQLQKMTDFRMSLDVFYDALVSWIPRKLWPGKPMAINVEYASTFFGSYGIRSGISGTCIGEFYWEYGFWGLMICMFLLGVGIQLFCNSCLYDLENEKAIIIYSVFLWPIIRISETPSLAFYQIIVLFIVTFLISKINYKIRLS